MAIDPRSLRPSASFPDSVIAEIQRAAREGLYEIRGFGGQRVKEGASSFEIYTDAATARRR